MNVGELLERLSGVDRNAPVTVVAGFEPTGDGDFELDELGEVQTTLWMEADGDDADYVVLVVRSSSEFLEYLDDEE